MSALVSAMDNYTSKNIGENGHVQYSWSNQLREKITQFFFQLVRCSDHTSLQVNHAQILQIMLGNETRYKKEFTIMYKLIAQTRDIIKGKGEQKLAFMQIYQFYNAGYHNLSKKAFKNFVKITNEHPYGSWKDVKYFCNYVLEKTADRKHPLIIYACDTAINQLDCDLKLYNRYIKLLDETPDYSIKPEISLVSRWIPREKSKKFGWINKVMIEMKYSYLINTAKTPTSQIRAYRKAHVKFKKIYTMLNKYLETIQIDQCQKSWSNINFNNVTSCTMRKQSRAFSNKKRDGSQRTYYQDRIDCAKKFVTHLEAAKSDPENHRVRGQRCSVGDLTRDALSIGSLTQSEKDRINLQWDDNKKNNVGLGNVIPCCDVSPSMECDNKTPLMNAIGLSIRASEMTANDFKNRVLTFDTHPQWIQLSDTDTFIEKANLLKRSAWGGSTDFYKMMNLILDVIIENNIPPETVENLILAVFSDMQFDSSISSSHHTFNVMYDNIEISFREAGMKTKYKVPYKPPHILFWNLRKTDGFPVVTNKKNVSMLSGFSSTLLNALCKDGIDAIKEYTPDKVLYDILDDDRYSFMDDALNYFYAN